MRRIDFIEAIYSAGWRDNLDAQHEQISKVWAEIFPSLAKLESELEELVEDAHQAGQASAGVDPSFSEAKNYRIRTLGKPTNM